MWAWPTQMVQKVLVRAPGIQESVGQDRQPVERPVLLNRLGQLYYDAVPGRQPLRPDRHGPERRRAKQTADDAGLGRELVGLVSGRLAGPGQDVSRVAGRVVSGLRHQ